MEESRAFCSEFITTIEKLQQNQKKNCKALQKFEIKFNKFENNINFQGFADIYRLLRNCTQSQKVAFK
jgi:hypothetical protein